MWIGTHIYDFLVLPKARVSSHVYLRRKRRQILVVGNPLLYIGISAIGYELNFTPQKCSRAWNLSLPKKNRTVRRYFFRS